MGPTLATVVCCTALIIARARMTAAVVVAEGPPPGTAHTYSYEVKVAVDRSAGAPKTPEPAILVSSLLEVVEVWRQPGQENVRLLQLLFDGFTVHAGSLSADSSSDADTTATQAAALGPKVQAALGTPWLILWDSGKVPAMYAARGESTEVVNLKRGVSSLMQLQPLNGTTTEVDASGECQVTYTEEADRLIKRKHPGSCVHPEDSIVDSNDDALGVRRTVAAHTELWLEGDAVALARSLERHTLSSNLQPRVGVNVTARQKLQLVKRSRWSGVPLEASVPGEAVRAVDPAYRAVPLPLQYEAPPSRHMTPTVPSVLASSRRFLRGDSLATRDAARAFLSLSRALAALPAPTLLSMLRAEDPDTLPQLLDAVVSAGTAAALDAALELLDVGGEEERPRELTERALYAWALAPSPSPPAMQRLLSLATDEMVSAEIRETLLVVLGTGLGKLCRTGRCHDKAARETLALLLSSLRGSGGAEGHKETERRVAAALALGNAALPEGTEALASAAEGSERRVATAAFDALRRFPPGSLTPQTRKRLTRLFHHGAASGSRRGAHDGVARSALAELLLGAEPTPQEVRNLLLSVGSAGAGGASSRRSGSSGGGVHAETGRLLLRRTRAMLATRHPSSAAIREALRDPVVNNYQRFSAAGLSSSCSGYVSRGRGSTATFDLDLLFSDTGLLRRSDLEVSMRSGAGQQLPALQVSLEAEGFDSFVGGDAPPEDEADADRDADGDADGDAGKKDERDEEEEETTDVTARMAAALLGVSLRPVTFFRGYADLLTKMWASGSEPTSVARALALLQRHTQILRLQCGLPTVVEVEASMGLDITGVMEVSLWSAQSHTRISSRGAAVVTAGVVVDVGAVRRELKVSWDAESRFDFLTGVYFSGSPSVFCMEVQRGETPSRTEVVATSWAASEDEEGPEEATRRWTGSRVAPPAGLPLHAENSHACRDSFPGGVAQSAGWV